MREKEAGRKSIDDANGNSHMAKIMTIDWHPNVSRNCSKTQAQELKIMYLVQKEKRNVISVTIWEGLE